MSSEYIGAGIYTLSEASRLAGVPRRSIRRWTLGYTYTRDDRRHWLPPIIQLKLRAVDGVPVLSFADLQELRFLDAFRKHGVSWRTLRLASDRAKEMIGSDHPFSTGRFVTDGYTILAGIDEPPGDEALQDIVRNQLVFKQIVAPLLRGLDLETRRAVRWFPGPGKLVVLDPARRFGQPITSREGVPTAVLAKAYNAERSAGRVASWYEVGIRSVRAAVEFERRLAA